MELRAQLSSGYEAIWKTETKNYNVVRYLEIEMSR